MPMPNKLIEGQIIPPAKLDGRPEIVPNARRALVGKAIKEVGYAYLGGEAFPAIILTDGTSIIAQCDDEMNGPGVLNIATPHGKETLLCEIQIKIK